MNEGINEYKNKWTRMQSVSHLFFKRFIYSRKCIDSIA